MLELVFRKIYCYLHIHASKSLGIITLAVYIVFMCMHGSWQLDNIVHVLKVLIVCHYSSLLHLYTCPACALKKRRIKNNYNCIETIHTTRSAYQCYIFCCPKLQEDPDWTICMQTSFLLATVNISFWLATANNRHEY